MNHQSSKELIKAGHAFTEPLAADAPLTEIARLVSALATRLDVEIACSNELRQKLYFKEDLTAQIVELRKELVEAAGRNIALRKERDAVVAENAALKSAIAEYVKVKQDFDDFDGDRRGIAETLCEAEDALVSGIKTPATDAYLNSVRAEGIHFAANRMLAAWEAGFIEATPGEAADIAGAVLSALEFLPRSQPDELKRDYADKVISEIRKGENKQ